MKTGFGRAVITPPVGFSLIGYFNDRRSTGIRDELCAIACVMEDRGTLFAVVSVDLVWIGAEIVKKAREIAFKATGIPSKNILVHATHTHTGPLSDMADESIYAKGFYVEPCYVEMLPVYIAGAIREAYENRKEVSVGSGAVQAPGLAFNRRYLMKDGRIVTNPWDKVKDIVEPAGPVDHTLRVIKITDRKTGKLAGIIANFADHPDTLGDNLISGDWPGMLRSKLEKEFPGTRVLFLNGPSGDINHINPDDPGRRGVEVPDRIAETLKKKTVNLVKNIKTGGNLPLKTYHGKFSMPARKVSPAELKSAKAVLREKNLPSDSLQYMISSSLVYAAEKISSGKKNYALEINGFSLGKDMLVLGLPGEVFTAIGAGIKKMSLFKHTLIAQNSNAHLGYVPSSEAFRQDEKNFTIKPNYGRQSLQEAIGIDCSYETSPLCCKVDRSAEEVFLRAAASLLK